MRNMMMLLVAVLLLMSAHRASAQVEVFQHSNFGGANLHLGFGQYPSLKSFGMNDKISSFWVDAGVEVTFYQATGFSEREWTLRGPCVCWSLPATQCSWWNDRFSSIIVREVPGVNWRPGSGRWGSTACEAKVHEPSGGEGHEPGHKW